MDEDRFEDPSVDVVGWLEHLEPIYEECRVFVAPLRYGAGMKGKVADSMARGMPVVTTTVGAEGMGLNEGADLLVADTADEFAAAVVRLYTDGVLWERVRTSGGEKVRERFGMKASRGYIEALLALVHDDRSKPR
jgi:glycosyltransferase involved in cell wall biosynthesis